MFNVMRVLIAMVVVFCIYCSEDTIRAIEDSVNKNLNWVYVVGYIVWVVAFILIADAWILFCL